MQSAGVDADFVVRSFPDPALMYADQVPVYADRVLWYEYTDADRVL